MAVDVVADGAAGHDGPVARLDGVDTPIPLADAAPGKAYLALRQEAVGLSASSNTGTGSLALPVTVETRVYLGARVRYVVRLGAHRVRCVMPAEPRFEPGETAYLQVPRDALRVVGD